jgi:hypothetical protein
VRRLKLRRNQSLSRSEWRLTRSFGIGTCRGCGGGKPIDRERRSDYGKHDVNCPSNTDITKVVMNLRKDIQGPIDRLTYVITPPVKSAKLDRQNLYTAGMSSCSYCSTSAFCFALYAPPLHPPSHGSGIAFVIGC